ncbi:hypothetical protein SEA_GENAMY16_42 [Gordonia phage Genamy16]|uniref:Terminase small subunit n=2 Tax=Lambovirus TaxID=2843412 RepID=A0A9E7Q951_9CAUD|nr:hypothetical protein SEA_GENAMY16_42 [Gordonia phage Genamy16]UVF61747.1 hypothetical protein SEA_NOVASHARKS_41 [Gordonia phage NovaSharks]
MPTYSADAIRAALADLPEDDTARAAMRKAANLPTAAPSEVHELHAAAYSALTGIDVDPKIVQIVLSLHGSVQRSALNRNRSQYRGRTVASLRKGAETLRENLAPLPAELPGARAARKSVATTEEPTTKAATTEPTTKATTPTTKARRTRKAPATTK